MESRKSGTFPEIYSHVSTRDDRIPESLAYCNEIGVLATTRVYPEVSGLATWSKNCKWHSSMPLGAVVSLFCELV
jgi:hypothetical protein